MFKLFVLLLSWMCWSQGATVGAEKRVLIIGDSLTEGYGVPKAAAYPAQLEKLLKEKGDQNVKVINAGSSGSTTASAVGRLRWHLKKKPDLLIIALGANDGLRGTPLQATKKNLSAAIDLAQKNNVRVFLAGMKLPMNYGKDYRAGFEAVFKELVATKKIKSIPFLLEGVAARPEMNLADGIHPNEQGHKVIAQTVFTAIRGDL